MLVGRLGCWRETLNKSLPIALLPFSAHKKRMGKRNKIFARLTILPITQSQTS
jgi:hypothetical protein